jgi:hypothetical protein
MVEGYIRERLQTAFPQLVWTENHYQAEDHTGTVYVEAGEKPDTYESDMRFPYYMVWVRSSDWDLAQRVAYGAVEILNKQRQIEYTDYIGNVYQIIFIESIADANRIGVNEGKMEWSANFKVTLRRKN